MQESKFKNQCGKTHHPLNIHHHASNKKKRGGGWRQNILLHSPSLRQNVFHDCSQTPEHVIALHVKEQDRRHEVHALAVAQPTIPLVVLMMMRW
jgi:hypothetical protein